MGGRRRADGPAFPGQQGHAQDRFKLPHGVVQGGLGQARLGRGGDIAAPSIHRRHRAQLGHGQKPGHGPQRRQSRASPRPAGRFGEQGHGTIDPPRQDPSRDRGGRAAWMAIKQASADARLQLGHRLSQRRLRQIDRRGRGADPAQGVNRAGGFEMAQVEIERRRHLSIYNEIQWVVSRIDFASPTQGAHLPFAIGRIK